jgi:tRNA-dihydrouridine synthase A
MPGARLWRRHLATEAVKKGAGLEVVREALAHVRRGSPEAERSGEAA